MSRRCVCGHDEDEHVDGIGCDAEVEAPDVFCACERFTLSDTDKERSSLRRGGESGVMGWTGLNSGALRDEQPRPGARYGTRSLSAARTSFNPDGAGVTVDAREIDALVATEIMGWELRADAWFLPSGPFLHLRPVWAPSTDIADAMRVVEKMRETHPAFTLRVNRTGWMVDFFADPENGAFVSRQPTPALAICKAALATKGIHVDTEEER